MALDPTIVVASITAWSSLMAVAVKGALDARAAKAQTNGMLHEPIREIRDEVRDLAAEVRDVKADVRDLKRGATSDRAVGDARNLRREAAEDRAANA